MTIGIMTAMNEEIDRLLAEMKDVEVIQAGMRTYYKGNLWDTPVVAVFSRWGKVAAATTTTYLIEHFQVDDIIFTGVAGGLNPALKVGDVVIANKLYQHDMNAAPLYPRHELPLLGVSGIATDSRLRAASVIAVELFLRYELPFRVAPYARREFRLTQPRLIVGEVASGDRFIASGAEREQLGKDLPGVVCVEMEGAAVAQVCHEYGVPFVVIRTISDSAGDGAASDFLRFIRQVASAYTHGILQNLLSSERGSRAKGPHAALASGSPSGYLIRT